MTNAELDQFFSDLGDVYQTVFGQQLLHAEATAYEGPTFPAGRLDFVICPAIVGPNGPVSMYIGIGTADIEKNNLDKGGYCWTVMRTLAEQAEKQYQAAHIALPYRELAAVIPPPPPPKPPIAIPANPVGAQFGWNPNKFMVLDGDIHGAGDIFTNTKTGISYTKNAAATLFGVEYWWQQN